MSKIQEIHDIIREIIPLSFTESVLSLEDRSNPKTHREERYYVDTENEDYWQQKSRRCYVQIITRTGFLALNEKDQDVISVEIDFKIKYKEYKDTLLILDLSTDIDSLTIFERNALQRKLTQFIYGMGVL